VVSTLASIECKTWFQNVPFKCNLRRYAEEYFRDKRQKEFDAAKEAKQVGSSLHSRVSDGHMDTASSLAMSRLPFLDARCVLVVSHRPRCHQWVF
jgi:hypothetical protein